MPTIGEAYIYLAKEFELPVAAVKNIGLRLLDHGLRDKSPRGAGAAQLKARDLTNHVIPLICDIGPKEAPHMTQAIGDLELAEAQVWDSDPESGIPLSDFPTAIFPTQILHPKGDTALPASAVGSVTPLLLHLPIAAKFGDTFAAILEKLAGPDDLLLEHVEIAIMPRRPAAYIRVRVAESKDSSQIFDYEIAFSSAKGKISKRRDQATHEIPYELLVDLAKLIARPTD